MSWVTDVLLSISVLESVNEDEEDLEEIPGIIGINAWLEEHDKGTLDNLDQHIDGGGKASQACLYGGAFNFLNIAEFIQTVKAQPWQEPENVQLLIKDDQEARYTLYTITEAE